MLKFVDHIDDKVHDNFVVHSKHCNLLQSSSWAKVKSNWDHAIVGVYDNDQLVASSLVLIKKLPLRMTMMYIPRGPVMDLTNEELVRFYFKELKKWAKKYHCLFIKVDPDLHINDYKIKDKNNNYYPITEVVLRIMKKAGLKHQGMTTYIKESIQPRYQANVYKCDDFDGSLPRHTRRLIRDALKRDVKVVKVGKDRVQDFSDVVALTEARKNVNLRNKDYFLRLMDIYGEDAYLFLAEVNIPDTLARLRQQQEENNHELEILGDSSPKKLRRLTDIKKSLEKDIREFEEFEKEYSETTVIAGILSIKFGNTMEMLYAGMNDKFKKFMPQYYLYTENMKYAFAHGCDFANMGGVEGDLQDGLTKFKSNFDPYINEYIGEFDLPVNSLLYGLSQWAYKVRKKRHSHH